MPTYDCVDCEDGCITCEPDEVAKRQCPNCKSKSSFVQRTQ